MDRRERVLMGYMSGIAKLVAGGKATEHSYRGALLDMVQALVGGDFTLTNEPKRCAK